MNLAEAHLQPHEATGIASLIDALTSRLGDDLLAIWLFGSKARGEAEPHSDIDLLIVVERLEPPLRWRIRELAADCSLEYDLLVNTHLLDHKRWDEHAFYQSTLWQEIRRDGILLYEAVGIC